MPDPSDDQEEEICTELPKILRKNRKIAGKTWLAGVGPRNAEIMIVTLVVSEEEAAEVTRIGYDKTKPRIPRVMECPQGSIIKDIALRNGVDVDTCFVVPIVRYLPVKKAHRVKPTIRMIREGLPLLEADIKEIKPKIIICMGKVVFDCLSNIKAKESEIIGGWFFSEKYQCKLYPMSLMTTSLNPEKHERFIMDFTAVKTMLDAIHGVVVPPVKTNYIVIHNSHELEELVNKLEQEDRKLLSIDCEWEGHQHVDGLLRSLQICWEIGQAAYIRFMDDKLSYAFDVSYKEAGDILARWVNRPDVHYIGHHVSADLPWMHYKLGLDWFGKAIFDSEFALQCCDESLSLGLDMLALRYTDLGKYDWDLIMFRKSNPDKRGDGYGQIPDDILIPYACKDVDTVMRAYPIIMQELQMQDLVYYYDKIMNPLVTDVFTAFCLNGLPIDKEKMDEMRDLYTWAKKALEVEFRQAMEKEADKLLKDRLREEFGEPGVEFADSFREKALELCCANEKAIKKFKSIEDFAGLFQDLLNFVGVDRIQKYLPLFDHFIIAPYFNIRSGKHMQRWLFEVKKYTPIKSTANKEAGVPSIDWSKVLTYPEDKQKYFKPATDKGTLEVLASRNKDIVIEKLLELNSVGNICKGFLKEAEVDDEGNLIKENGLHYWLASDGRIHLNNSCTETGRIRSWNPNTLNWPSWIHARTGAGMVRIIKEKNELGELPARFKKWTSVKAKNFPTIRSVMMAEKDWCIVEADYQTAEMRGLAYISGDEKLIALIEDPDECFAKVKPECVPEGIDPEDCVVRLSYPDYISKPDNKDDYIMTYTVNGDIKARFTEEQLLRDDSGKIVSPRFDMHWGVLEMARSTCREVQDKKKDRGAGKVVNFSSSYGGQAASLARKIEADTGTKPEIEEVEAMLEAIERRQPRATQFFKEMEEVPTTVGFIRAKSGRIRHCHVLADNITGLSVRTREGQLTALGRECRNFPMQENVGASAARACYNLINFGRETGLKGYLAVCLYDSCVVHCPVEERAIWSKALTLYMTEMNGWGCGKRVLRYPIDSELNAGWSTKPDANFAEKLHNPDWHPTPDSIKHIEDWLDMSIDMYKNNPELSVTKY